MHRARLRLWEELLDIEAEEMNRRKQRTQERLNVNEERRLATEEFQRVAMKERAGTEVDTAENTSVLKARKLGKRARRFQNAR